MQKIFILICFVFVATIAFAQKKTILVILAHPDDEGALPQLLTKLGKENKVYLIIATDGRYGVRFNNPSGDTLGAIRQKESECACKIMGIQPPIFLGFHDGMGMITSVPEFFKQTAELTETLKERIDELKPDLIITFGPDGDTGHSDHRHISAITTEVILREGWVDKYPLYYLAWTNKDSKKYKDATGIGLRTMDTQYFNVQINFSEEEEDKGLASINCYVSQSTPEERKLWSEAEKKDKSNTLYFRKFVVKQGIQEGF